MFKVSLNLIAVFGWTFALFFVLKNSYLKCTSRNVLTKKNLDIKVENIVL